MTTLALPLTPIKEVKKMQDANARLDTHEQVCAIRYEGIHARLKRLEGILIASAGAIILFMAHIAEKIG